MKTFVVFLRGINVSGHRIIKMARFKELLEAQVHFFEVETYLQTGNIILKSTLNAVDIVKQIEALILTEYNFDVVVFCFEKATFNAVLTECPFDPDQFDRKKLAITFLKGATTNQAQIDELLLANQMPEEVKVGKSILYTYYVNGLGRSKFSSQFIERKLKVQSTTRNINTLLKLKSKLA